MSPTASLKPASGYCCFIPFYFQSGPQVFVVFFLLSNQYISLSKLLLKLQHLLCCILDLGGSTTRQLSGGLDGALGAAVCA